MNGLFAGFTGICIVLIACSCVSRNESPDGAASPAVDAVRTDTSIAGSVGNAATGGATGGMPNASGGTSAKGGASATGGGAVGTDGQGGRGGAGVAGSAGGKGGAGVSDQGGSTPLSIDFSIWSLQLPIGSGTSPTTVSPSQLMAGFSSEYFYLAADGGQIFMDPATGTTTPNSAHCRTEMHEKGLWLSTGTNTMTVSGKVLQVGGGAAGRVTVGQVFNDDGNFPLCELEYATSRGGLTLLYEEAKGSGANVDLQTPVALNERYTFTLALSQGVLTVTINGKQVYTKTPGPATAAGNYYFKVGNYDQTAVSGAISTVPYTAVEAYSVGVVHQ